MSEPNKNQLTFKDTLFILCNEFKLDFSIDKKGKAKITKRE